MGTLPPASLWVGQVRLLAAQSAVLPLGIMPGRDTRRALSPRIALQGSQLR